MGKVDYRDGLLRLKAIMMGGHQRGNGLVHRTYVIEKIDTVLGGGEVGLDKWNTKIYEKLKKSEA